MKLQEEKNTLNKLDEVCENNQILWHDLKHYLTVVQGMLYTSGVEKTTKYLEELLQNKFESDLYYYTDSTVLNVVLNDKASLCKKIIFHAVQKFVDKSERKGGRKSVFGNSNAVGICQSYQSGYKPVPAIWKI